MTNDDRRRRPDEFLDEVRDMRARRDQRDHEPINPAAADQIHAASRDARSAMGQAPELRVLDVEVGEREEAFILALGAAAERRSLHSPHGPNNPRPEVINLTDGRPGHCDVCETRAHRLDEIYTQYGPYIFRARLCVRCRRFAPPQPPDS